MAFYTPIIDPVPSVGGLSPSWAKYGKEGATTGFAMYVLQMYGNPSSGSVINVPLLGQMELRTFLALVAGSSVVPGEWITNNVVPSIDAALGGGLSSILGSSLPAVGVGAAAYIGEYVMNPSIVGVQGGSTYAFAYGVIANIVGQYLASMY